MSPDTLACQALLNCLIREVSAPEDQAWADDEHLVIRLARSAVLLRAGSATATRLSPRSCGPARKRTSRPGRRGRGPGTGLRLI
jgi:hypothetical protein